MKMLSNLRVASWLFASAIVSMCLHAGSTHAQIDPNDPTVLGVAIDAEGLMAIRQPTDNLRLRTQRKIALARAMKEARPNKGDADQLVYVSLPRLFAEVKTLIDASKPVPDELKYLHGMTKLRYIFVFPDERDLVIAGDVEPFDAELLSRPIGMRTGRPVLQLDDLVVALRTVGPGNGRNQFGCSIDPQAGAMKKVNDIIQDPANRRLSKTKKAALMADAIGHHTCRFFGVKPESRVALVLIEADYLLKRLAMGIDPPPIPQVRRSPQSKRLQANGMWFTPSYEPLLVSKDGLAYEIRGQSLKLNARGSLYGNEPPTPETGAYVKLFTKHYPEIAEKIPAFADLWNITDLATLAALIGHDRLHEKTNWDLSWLLSDSANGYPVRKLTVPKTAASLARYQSGVYIVGGVTLQFHDVVSEKNRKVEDDGQLSGRVVRPTNDAWNVVK